MVHGPVLAAGPETSLAGVWARRPDAAAALADRLGVRSYDRFEALLDDCEAVAFAVPPAVQATMAAQAAAAGKAVLLEKPIAADLDGAERLADAVGSAGVASLVVLTFRFADGVRSFLDAARASRPIGGRGWFVSGGLLGASPFATPWRLVEGPLLDLGPHVLDLLDAALGPIVSVRAHGTRLGWVGLLCDHESGAASEASLCATVAVDPHRAGAEVYGDGGVVEVDAAASARDVATFATMRADFAAACAAGATSHPLDVHRGLHLQRLLAAASESLGAPTG
jgi:predicted dehydrogenase